jgi:DNA-directed RNA polymerase subunit omega
MLPWENDKPTVVALREVAEGLVNADTLAQIEQAELEQEAADEIAAVISAEE